MREDLVSCYAQPLLTKSRNAAIMMLSCLFLTSQPDQKLAGF